MSFQVQMAIKPVCVAPTDAGLQESLTFVAKRLRPVTEALVLRAGVASRHRKLA